MDRFIDIATKLAATLIIPLVIWGVRLEVQLSVAESERQNMRAEITRLENQNQSILLSIRENTVALSGLNVSLTYVRDRVDEIRDDVRASRGSSNAR